MVRQELGLAQTTEAGDERDEADEESEDQYLVRALKALAQRLCAGVDQIQNVTFLSRTRLRGGLRC